MSNRNNMTIRYHHHGIVSSNVQPNMSLFKGVEYMFSNLYEIRDHSKPEEQNSDL